jgi:hypothetical protein
MLKLTVSQGTLAQDWYGGSSELVGLYGEPPSDSETEQSDDEAITTIWLSNGERTAPGHYVRFLVDGAGSPPMPSQLLAAIRIMRQYVDRGCDERLALKIDNAKGVRRSSFEADIQAGSFYFLCPDKNKRSRAQSRIESILIFCNCLENRILAMPLADRDQPDVRPLSYTGYALLLMRRLSEHDGDKTSYLMTLIEHVLIHLGLEYEWESFITGYCTSPDEASIGEVLMNGLAQSYHNTSYGVAVHPAGENCASAQFSDKAYSDVQACLEDCVRFRWNITPYETNMKRERESLEHDLDLRERAELARTKSYERLKQSIEDNKPDLEALRKLQAAAKMPERGVPPHIKAHFASIHARVDRIIQEWTPVVADIEEGLEN